MLKIFDYKDKELWEKTIRLFSQYDVYYTYFYATSLMLHGDGNPKLVFFADGNIRLCYVVMEKDISEDDMFSDLNKSTFFDWETPYGYGGPLLEGVLNEKSINDFSFELEKYCLSNGVVSQFIRFNPIIRNNTFLPSIIESKYLKSTIFIDTSSEEIVFSNLDSKCRNLIRKAQKNDVKIIIKPGTDYKDFLCLYNQTMAKDNASDYYYFSNSYFDTLAKLGDSELIFYAYYQEKPIAASIMLQINGTMHYHLSGSNYEFRNLCPTHLLLYEAALWCVRHNIKKLHLGGGISLGNDGLFHFKSQFNKNGKLDFYLGRTIFNKEIYDFLCNKRLEKDSSFDIQNSFMIQYRK